MKMNKNKQKRDARGIMIHSCLEEAGFSAAY